MPSPRRISRGFGFWRVLKHYSFLCGRECGQNPLCRLLLPLLLLHLISFIFGTDAAALRIEHGCKLSVSLDGYWFFVKLNSSKKSYPQFVLLGDSLFEQSVTVQGGFSLIATLQDRELPKLFACCLDCLILILIIFLVQGSSVG